MVENSLLTETADLIEQQEKGKFGEKPRPELIKLLQTTIKDRNELIRIYSHRISNHLEAGNQEHYRSTTNRATELVKECEEVIKILSQ